MLYSNDMSARFSFSLLSAFDQKYLEFNLLSIYSEKNSELSDTLLLLACAHSLQRFTTECLLETYLALVFLFATSCVMVSVSNCHLGSLYSSPFLFFPARCFSLSFVGQRFLLSPQLSLWPVFSCLLPALVGQLCIQ